MWDTQNAINKCLLYRKSSLELLIYFIDHFLLHVLEFVHYLLIYVKVVCLKVQTNNFVHVYYVTFSFKCLSYIFHAIRLFPVCFLLFLYLKIPAYWWWKQFWSKLAYISLTLNFKILIHVTLQKKILNRGCFIFGENGDNKATGGGLFYS